MPLSSLIEREFGVKTGSRENPITDSVGITAARVLPNNPNRLGWILVNLSVNLLYLGFSPDVSSSKGIQVGSNGGMASMVYKEDFELAAQEVYAVAAGANSAIYVVETFIVGE